MKAIDSVKNRPEYANLRIAHGKDRCANPPRSGPQAGGISGGRRHGNGNGHGHGNGPNIGGGGGMPDDLCDDEEGLDGVGLDVGVGVPSGKMMENQVEAAAAVAAAMQFQTEVDPDVRLIPGVGVSDMGGVDLHPPAPAIIAAN